MTCIPCGKTIRDEDPALIVYERSAGGEERFEGVILCMPCALSLDKRLVVGDHDSGGVMK